MPDLERLLSLDGPTSRPLSCLIDAEVVLLDAVIDSGGQTRPVRREDPNDAEAARELDLKLRAAVSAEMRARGITTPLVAARLVARALARLAP